MKLHVVINGFLIAADTYDLPTANGREVPAPDPALDEDEGNRVEVIVEGPDGARWLARTSLKRM